MVSNEMTGAALEIARLISTEGATGCRVLTPKTGGGAPAIWLLTKEVAMNTAAKVREAKEKNPENFCPDPHCLWRVETRDETKPCPKHMPPTPKPWEILGEAIRHLRRTHMNTYSWSMTVSDEEAIDILSNAIVAVAK